LIGWPTEREPGGHRDAAIEAGDRVQERRWGGGPPVELAADPVLGSIPRDQLAARLHAIGESTARTTITTASQDDDDARVARALRAVATPAQLQDAAALLDGDHPKLARLLSGAMP
jgi:hypothetical protein